MNRFLSKKEFRKKSGAKRAQLICIAGVLFTHILAVISLQVFQEKKAPKPSMTKVLVQTVQLQPNLLAKERIKNESQTTNSLQPKQQDSQKTVAQNNPSVQPKQPAAPAQAKPVPINEPIPKESVPKEVPKPKKEVVKKAPEQKKEIIAKPTTQTIPKPVDKKPSKPPVTKPAIVNKSTDIKKESATSVKKNEVKSNAAAPKSVAATPSKSVSKTIEQPAWTIEQEKLWSTLQQNIASLDSTSSKKNTNSTAHETAKQIANLNVDGSPRVQSQKDLIGAELSYKDELVRRLKLLLKLPELGEIKMQLTIDRDGTVAKLVVLQTESQKNRNYVETTLPTLHLPAFGDRFKDKNQYTFPVTLSNE